MSNKEAGMGADRILHDLLEGIGSVRAASPADARALAAVLNDLLAQREAALAAQHEAEQREAAIVEELGDIQVAYQREIRRRIQVEEAVDAVIAEMGSVPSFTVMGWRQILATARQGTA